MKNKGVLILVGSLVVLAAIVLLWDFVINQLAKSKNTLLEFLLEPTLQFSVDKIKISKDSQSVTLEKNTDGVWYVILDEAQKKFPANAYNIAKLLDNLVSNKISSQLYNIDKEKEKFGFDVPTKLELWAQGKPLLEAHIGSMRSTGGQYVKVKDKGYLLEKSIDNLYVSEDSWELKKLFGIKKDQIKKFEFFEANSKFPLIIEREKPNEKLKITSKVKKELIVDSEVENLEKAYEDIHFSYRYDLSNEEAKASFSKPHKAKIYLFDGRTYDIQIGYIKKHQDKHATQDSYKYFIKVTAQKGSEPLSSDEEFNLNQLNDIMQNWYCETYEYIAKKFIKTPKDFEKKTN